MRPVSQAIVFSLLALTATASIAASSSTPPPETPQAFLRRMQPILHRDEVIAKTNEEWNKIHIPKFELRDTLVTDAIDGLNQRIRDHNSDPSAFQIPLLRIRHYPGLLPAQSAPSATPDVSSPTKPDSSPANAILPEDARLTLSLSNITLFEAIRYVTNLAGLRIEIENDAIWLNPSCPESIILFKTYKIPDSICSTKTEAEKLLMNLIPYIRPLIRKNFGEYWKFNESTHVLTLRYPDGILDKFEIGYARILLNPRFKIPASPPPPPLETPQAVLKRMKPVLEHDAFVSKIDGELKQIPIQKIEVREASLSNTIDELNLHTRDHNSQPSALQIPLLRIQFDSPNEGLTQQARLTFSLSNSTVSEVLRYAVNVSGMMIDIKPDAICIRPLSSGGLQVLVKRVYLMPGSICSTKAQAKKLLTGITPDYKTTPDSPLQLFWNFDKSSHLLTLSFGEYVIEDFEKNYARELLKRGFKTPVTTAPHTRRIPTGVPDTPLKKDVKRAISPA